MFGEQILAYTVHIGCVIMLSINIHVGFNIYVLSIFFMHIYIYVLTSLHH